MINPQLNIKFSQLTTLHIGGPITYYIETTKEDELQQALQFATKKNISYLLIGDGSNLLVSDQGFDGLVIKNSVIGIELQGDLVIVQSGTKLQDLITFTIGQGLSGLHKLIGIPGTVGGAIFGNAGAYGATISDCLVSVSCLDQSGNKVVLNKDQCQFAYRDSLFKRNHLIILEATLQLPSGNIDQLKTESNQILATRLEKYKPDTLCPGSFFKNFLAAEFPEDSLKHLPEAKIIHGKIPAGWILELAGAKGDQLGQIAIAPHHANLFVNLGGGTAEDFYNLAKKWSDNVWELYKVRLEPEVQLINLPPLS